MPSEARILRFPERASGRRSPGDVLAIATDYLSQDVEERKALHVAEAERLHAQDDAGERHALDLRIGVRGPRRVVGFFEQPEATVPTTIRATRGSVKRDMVLSSRRSFNGRYRCWSLLGKRENLDPPRDGLVDSVPQRVWESN